MKCFNSLTMPTRRPSFIFLSSLFLLAAPAAVYAVGPLPPDPDACPVESAVTPTLTATPHDNKPLAQIASGMPGIRWESRDGDEIAFRFASDVVVRRFAVALTRAGGGAEPAQILMSWRPQTGDWPPVTRELNVPTDGSVRCFVLGSHAGLPENVQGEIRFALPPGIDLQTLRFSDRWSDQAQKSCPTPFYFASVNRAYKAAQRAPRNREKVDAFVSKLKRLMPKYDCRRAQDYEPVPAWSMCGTGRYSQACSYADIDRWFSFISKAPSPAAKRLFASEEFRQTLDGEYAESYQEASEQAAKK